MSSFAPQVSVPRHDFAVVSSDDIYTGKVLTVFFGIGVIWAFIDGIVILAGRPTDGNGRPLHP